jgi:hypothetical protein
MLEQVFVSIERSRETDIQKETETERQTDRERQSWGNISIDDNRDFKKYNNAFCRM